MATAYVEYRSGTMSGYLKYFSRGYVDSALTTGIPEGTLVYFDGASKTWKVADQNNNTDAQGIVYAVTNKDVRSAYSDNPTSNWMPKAKGGDIMEGEMKASVKIKEDTLKFRMVDETLTGTVATAGTTALTGTGTAFLTELKVGDYIVVAGETVRQVASITSDTAATVSVAFTNTDTGLAVTGKSMYRKPVYLGTTTTSNKFGKLGLANYTTLVPITGDGQSKMVGWIEDEKTLTIDLTLQLVPTTL